MKFPPPDHQNAAPRYEEYRRHKFHLLSEWRNRFRAFLEGDQVIPFSDIKGAWKFLALKSNPNFVIEGTYSGLYLYEVKNEKWELVGKIKGFDESARILEEDNEGNIWVTHNLSLIHI